MNNTVQTITGFFSTFINSIAQALPNVLGALGLLLIGLLLARIVARIIAKVLISLKVDTFSDKLKEIELLNSLSIKISTIAQKLVYWVILLIFLTAASEVVGLDSVSQGIAAFLAYLPHLVSAVLFFVAGIFIASLIQKVITAACESMNISGSRIIGLFVFYFFVIIISISALNQAGIDTDIITQNVTLAIGAIFLAFAIGYGFASKDIMANLLASFYSRDKFSVGQQIRVGDVTGAIIKIDNTSVTLDAGDRHIILPLSRLLNSTVEIF